MKALGLNRAESMFRWGQYLEDPKLPARLGYEAAGTVEAVGAGREGLQGRRRGEHHPGVFAERVRCLRRHWRTSPATPWPSTQRRSRGSRRRRSGCNTLTAYGRPDRHREADERRHGGDPRGLQQRRHRGDPDREPGRCDADRADASQERKRQPCWSWGGPRHRHRRAGPGRGGHEAHGRQGSPRRVRPRRRPDRRQARRGDGPVGILFLYGALSTEPTPLPLFEVLGKWLTIRGYVLLEITGDPERLERAKKFIVDGLATGSSSRSSPRRSRSTRSSRPTATWSRTSRSARSSSRSDEAAGTTGAAGPLSGSVFQPRSAAQGASAKLVRLP